MKLLRLLPFLLFAGFANAQTVTPSIKLGAAGVNITQDGDGAITFAGVGNGSDENLTINLDDTANTIVLSSSTGVTTIDISLATAILHLGSAGVSLSDDGDGAITLTGRGNGSDEDLTLNFDDTANEIVASTSTSAALNLGGISTIIGPLQGSEGSNLHVIYSAIGSGTAYTMTATYATVDMGTTDPSITIAATGTYRIYANVQLSFAGTTYAAFDSATFKLRRTNNTAADVSADGERGTHLPIMTTTTMLGPSVLIGPVEYSTALTDDVIVVQGDLNATPSAGTVTVTKCTIYAERVRQ